MSRLSKTSAIAGAIFTALIFCLQVSAQTSLPGISTEDELRSDLILAPCASKQRAEAVSKLFQRMGAAETEISSEKIKDVQNIIVTKKGRVDETIIVGAHYDKTSDGCGAIDNWSGIVMVAHLYRTLRSADTQKNYVFVAFDKEEIGLVGSARMANSIPKENRKSYCAMVNLDSFGFTYPQVLTNTSNAKMTDLAKSLAAEVKMPFGSASLAGVADADSSSFLAKDIPAVTFHGLSDKWKQYLHTSSDKVENVNAASVRVGYNFLLAYLEKLDASPCSVFRK